MMRCINRVTLLGRVGKDLKLKTTGGGKLVANLSIATEDSYKDASGEWQKQTDWHNIVAWGKSAEVIRDYVSKGDKLMVEGKQKTRSWDDKQSGQKRYTTEVLVESLYLLEDRREGKQRPAVTASDVGFEPEISDDDIPF